MFKKNLTKKGQKKREWDSATRLSTLFHIDTTVLYIYLHAY